MVGQNTKCLRVWYDFPTKLVDTKKCDDGDTKLRDSVIPVDYGCGPDMTGPNPPITENGRQIMLIQHSHLHNGNIPSRAQTIWRRKSQGIAVGEEPTDERKGWVGIHDIFHTWGAFGGTSSAAFRAQFSFSSVGRAFHCAPEKRLKRFKKELRCHYGENTNKNDNPSSYNRPSTKVGK